MRLLVDTHVLLWSLTDQRRIRELTRATLADATNEVFVSAITPFELATKERIGRLPTAKPILLAYDDYLRRFGATELPITSHHGLIAGSLAWENRDPFDRMIAAQAITESLHLVTSDSAFSSLGAVRILWE